MRSFLPLSRGGETLGIDLLVILRGPPFFLKSDSATTSGHPRRVCSAVKLPCRWSPVQIPSGSVIFRMEFLWRCTLVPWSQITLVVTESDFKKNGGPRRMTKGRYQGFRPLERGGGRGRIKSLDRGPPWLSRLTPTNLI